MTTFDNSNSTANDVLLELTAELVAAYVSNNSVPAGDLPTLIADVHSALGRVGGGAEAVVAVQE
ncbi:MAG: MucR family transcriptional regulator, partial [Phyllobacterium sp.]